MKVFHGSIVVVSQPVIIASQRLIDFGKGFYTTGNQAQAERWAVVKKQRQAKNAKAIVSVYEIPELPYLEENYNVKAFKRANEEWLDFVFANRKGTLKHDFEIVFGPVANDTLYATLSLYEAGILNKTETIKRLKVHKLFDQISFHNDRSLKSLIYMDNYEVV